MPQVALEPSLISSPLVSLSPDPCIAFYADNEVIGELSWKDGVLKFEGNVDESAKLFFEHMLKPVLTPE